MRYAILGDIHSNLEAFECVLGALKDAGIDKYLCAGDVVGYGPNPQECISLLKALTPEVIAGNHDWASVNLFSSRYFNHAASEAIHWTKNNIRAEDKEFLESLKLVYRNEHLTMVHGTLNKPQDFDYMNDGYIAEESFRILDTPICFVAHSHTPGVFIKDKEDYIVYRQEDLAKVEECNRYIINVGSVGQPRDGNPAACYCIYDTASKEISIKRIAYNTHLVREKIIFSGLPRSLGDRLLMGV